MHNVISSSSLCAEGEIFLSERMTFFNAFILFSLTAVPGTRWVGESFGARLTVPFPRGVLHIYHASSSGALLCKCG